ncbi:hypothetical protein FTO74_00140 [Granulicella sp. WH15]|uniref:hypothetical protein n=1 Tax=Granulicella sp. WH15 TaxID=2602070 RepID=UPI001366D5B8|nr:hypothetical protein [Granulicella sp. WH15]QHN01963.1 hypothetical protein FTO74_00140 [Granulicella sp. WH15]
MGYLLPTEYVGYGLAAETSDDWVTMASALVEAQCRRPSLMAQQYTERLRITAGAQTARLSYGPLAPGALISANVRYARPRRGELEGIGFQAQIATAFGLPGAWTTLDVATIDVDCGARELTFPTNFLGIAYNEAEITYTAGFVTVPVAIKIACAQIVKNAQATPALNVKSSRMDTMQMQYFSGSLIDPQVEMLLKPYRAEKLG